jgi:hypothetical protein
MYFLVILYGAERVENMQTNSHKIKQKCTKERKPYNNMDKQEKQHKAKRVDKRQAFVIA